MFEPFYQQSAFVIDARIVRTAQALHIARLRIAPAASKSACASSRLSSQSKTEETGPIPITLVVRVIDDGAILPTGLPSRQAKNG